MGRGDMAGEDGWGGFTGCRPGGGLGHLVDTLLETMWPDYRNESHLNAHLYSRMCCAGQSAGGRMSISVCRSDWQRVCVGVCVRVFMSEVEYSRKLACESAWGWTFVYFHEHLCVFVKACVCERERDYCVSACACVAWVSFHEWLYDDACVRMNLCVTVCEKFNVCVCIWVCVCDTVSMFVGECTCESMRESVCGCVRASERVGDWMWVSTILLHCILNECQYVPVTSTLWCSIHTHSYPFHDIYPLYDHIVCVHVCVCMSVWERNAFKAYLLSAEPPGQQVWEARRVCCSVVKLCRKCLLKYAHFAFLLLL